MPLLYEEDYTILNEHGFEYEEDQARRFLVIKNFPLPNGMYTYSEKIIESVEVLYIIPANYNSSGGDMLWVHPELKRTDGKSIPAAAVFGGGDSRIFMGKEYCRWSRHFLAGSWIPKQDNILKIINRIQWALNNPDANR